MVDYKDLTGKTFGALSVLAYVGDNPVRWRCRCGCGTYMVISSNALRKGKTSCGCITRQSRQKQMTSHGMSNSKLYRIWGNLKQRCNNPNSNNPNHLGLLCDGWQESNTFIEWALANGYKDGDYINRHDIKQGFNPDNCFISDKPQRYLTASLTNEQIKQRLNQLEAERKQAILEREQAKQAELEDNKVYVNFNFDTM